MSKHIDPARPARDAASLANWASWAASGKPVDDYPARRAAHRAPGRLSRFWARLSAAPRRATTRV